MVEGGCIFFSRVFFAGSFEDCVMIGDCVDDCVDHCVVIVLSVVLVIVLVIVGEYCW
jgi:hypothetical protein